MEEGNYTDMICPGLNLRVGTTRKTWSVYHRTGGRLKQSKLGYFPAMALADARKAARELVERLAAGAPPLPPEPHPSASLTLGGLIDRYQAHRRRKGGRGTKSLAQSIRVVRNGLKDYLALPAASFSKHDLRVARDVIAARAPTAANRTQAYLSPILRWAEAEDLIPYDFSRAVIRVGREVKRNRILSHHEIKAVWAACDKLDDTIEQRSYARLVRFLLLTGQRRGEAAGLQHGHVFGGVWRQSADSHKAGREHKLRLPLQALGLLGIGTAHQWCFPGATGGPITGAWTRLKAELDRLSGVQCWRLHDLRRTFASGLQELSVDYWTIEALLNHSLPGVAGVYVRAELDVARASALRLWAVEIERIVGSASAGSGTTM